MKVFLTGANGFVGSHILEGLLARKIPATILLRPTSDTRFIDAHLDKVNVCRGGLNDADGLRRAATGSSCVIHCAGATRATRRCDYDRANREGTKILLQACTAPGATMDRFVLVSSLAASGPGTPEAPAREDAQPVPVSDYGRSKLAGEEEVRTHSRFPYTILRPAAVYGPRDRDFLRLFRAVRGHLAPRFAPPRPLSLVYIGDLVEAVFACLDQATAAGRSYHVASPHPVTSADLLEEIQRQMGTWTLPLPLPRGALWCGCLAAGALARWRDRPSILNRDKYRELTARGWVCDTLRMAEEIGFVAGTPLPAGVASTLAWYRDHEWL